MARRSSSFKDRVWWRLDGALEKEKEKLSKCPLKPDLLAEYEVIQAWGYVVVGYFLVEESFKALLHLQGKDVPTKHSLTLLFDGFGEGDKDVLREYYIDYRETGGWPTKFPIETLDEFLKNLDGDINERGTDHVGSFDWRYFLIEEKRSAKMPTVGVEFLHEIAYGCIRMVEWTDNGSHEPLRSTHSWRLRSERDRKRMDWLMVRMNTEGWADLPERWEIAWGPDYKGRYDLQLFRGDGRRDYFAPLPQKLDLPVIDKRKEFESFDVEAGLRSIGVTRVRRYPP